jgi:hypothetical protein
VQLSKCGHAYCASCVGNMFDLATHDETFFPPKCCSHSIDITTIHQFLHRPQIKAYNKKAAEFRTPGKCRRYCADTSCSSFLGRANNGILRCDKCGQMTCDICKSYAHTGLCRDQGRDLEKLDADFEKLALAEGWKACPACTMTVALTEGCNHITSVLWFSPVSYFWTN